MASRVIALPPHGIHLHINNRFRNNNEDAWNFTVPNTSIQLDSGFYLMQIKQVVTENFINTIQPGLNDVFAVVVNGQAYELLLPASYYDIESMVQGLNTFLATINVNLMLIYDYNTRKLSVSIPAATTFSFYSPLLKISYQYRNDYPSKYDRLLSMLGFIEQMNLTFSGASVLIANNPVNLKYTTSIRIVTNQHINVVGTDSENQQVLVTIPIVVGYGEVIDYEPVQPRTFAMSSYALDSFRISVIDDYNNKISVPEYTGLSISLTLLQAATSFT